MEVCLKKVNENDQFDGLKVLQQITKENFEESPLPFKFNDYWYDAFLKLVKEEEEKKECIAYWVTYGKKKIGYAEIRPNGHEIAGNIGIILENEYQGKGYGLKAMKLLVSVAKNEYNVKDIEITTNPNNTGMRKICEKLGGELVDIDEKCHYQVK